MPLSNEAIAKQAQILKLKRQCADDPVLFFRTFLYTFNPKVSPSNLPFDPFPFQEDLILDLVSAIEHGYDVFVDKTREMGVTYTTLGVLLWFWLFKDASNFLVGSRKENIVDNTGKVAANEVSNKEESLFGKMDYMLNRIPPIVLPDGFDPQTHRTYMSLRNPENGNVIGGESANSNFSRGGRQRAILLDEFAFWDNDSAAWGSTADTTNCRIVVTTPGIRPNTKAKRLRFGKDGETIKLITLPYNLDPRKDDKWLQQQRERRSMEDFNREIMIDWEGSTAGVVYPEARNREVGDYPYNPDWPLYLSWDFGLDGTAQQWWQPNPTNGKMRLVDAFTKEDKPIQWFYPLLGKPIDSLFQYSEQDIETANRVKDFKKAIHYGDPDVSKRSMTSENLTSVRAELMKIGIHVQTNTQGNTFVNRREKTKVMLQKGIEVNDTPGTQYWVEAMDNARYPQRSDTSQATSAITLPIHDWTSHPRTATEYFAVNYSPQTVDVRAYKPESMLRQKYSRSKN
jgi:hypothetical protein